MRIDIHTHFLPDDYRGALARHGYDAPSATASLREMAPLDHIAFGSDWPFSALLFAAAQGELPAWAGTLAPRDRDPAPRLVQLAAQERAQVDHGTAEALLPRLAAAPHA
jgi:predicted TIM-barrel fold metal-dependent hydrolase